MAKNTTTQSMTPAQETRITTLAAELTGRHIRWIADAIDVLPVSKSAISRGLSRADASQCIDSLQAQIKKKGAIEEQRERTPVETGTLTAAQVLEMLGRQVEITFAGANSSGTVTGKVDSIVPSGLDGTPALALSTRRGPVRVSVITAWRILA